MLRSLRSRAPGWPRTTPSLGGTNSAQLGEQPPPVLSHPSGCSPGSRAVLGATDSSPDLGTPEDKHL